MYKNFNNKIIIGTANFGKKYGIKKNKISNKELKKIFFFLNQKNLRIIDTSENYGSAENIISKNIADNKKKWKIITKISDDGEKLNEKYDKIVAKFGIKPTVLMAHNANDFKNLRFRKKLLELKKINKIKIGVSVYTKSEILNVLKYDNLDVIQLPVSIIDQRLVKNNFLKKIKKKGIEIHARSIFFKGVIFKKKEFFKKNKIYYRLIESFEKNYKYTPSQICLNWINNQKYIDKIILGIDSLNQLKKNLYDLKYFKKKTDFKVLNIPDKYLDLRKI
tara:strand:+ start:946 stop:1776 length:831 start_codon:yes stop_codon:yes gene_type:complete